MENKKQLIIELDELEWFLEALKEYQNELNPRRPLEETEFIYCLVGNVVPCHYYGEEKKIVRGTRQFSANAKLYVFPRIGNYSGERVRAIGLSRKTKRLKFAWVPVNLITDWRLKKVYKRKIIEIMFHENGWRDTERDRDTILNMIPWLTELTEKELPFKD